MLDLLFPRVCLECEGPADGLLCEACGRLDPRGLAPIDGIHQGFAAAPYAGPIGHALRRAKAAPDRDVSVWLASRFVDGVTPLVHAPPDWVVPAPTTAWRRFRRGHHPAALLAGALAARLGVPVANALRRQGGRRQTTVARDDRAANLRGRLHARASVSGRVLLVDDVVTTGATAVACAEVLRGAGADEVVLAVLCDANTRPEAGPSAFDTNVRNL